MIDADIYLVLGVIVAALSIPAVLVAIADSRPPRVATLTVLIGGGLMLYAVVLRHGDFEPGQIPEAFSRVLLHLRGS